MSSSDGRACLLVSALVLPGILACGEPVVHEDPIIVEQHPAAVRITPGTPLVMSSLEDTASVIAEVVDEAGRAIPDATVTFVSTDSLVASVDSAGLVRAISNGNGYVVAAASDLRDSVAVNVEQIATVLAVDPAMDSIWVLGDGPHLSVRATDANGHDTPIAGVAWSSSDTSTVAVDDQGRTSARADGTAMVTARLDDATGQSTLVVDERGWISISVEEHGGGRDPDGYVVSLGDATYGLSGDTTHVVSHVPAGTYSVSVEGDATHCLPRWPPTAQVEKGDTAMVAIGVRCSGRFAFEDRVPPTYDYQLHYFDEVGEIVVLSEDEIRRGEYAWSRDGSWMALAKDIDGNTDIYIVRADGSGERRLTLDPAEDITPTWSPDGRRVAFRRVGADGGLWTIDVETGSVEQLTEAALSAGPSWSPSDELIVFSAPDPVEPWNSDLWSIRPDGSDLTQLTADGGGLGYKELVWSPDGTRLAVTRPAAAGWELVIMNPDGASPIVAATSGQSGIAPSWSPDGTSIVFTKHDGVDYGAYMVSADGSGEVALTPDRSATAATYSADGTHLLLTWTDVAAMNLDGSGFILLTETTASDPLPRPGG